MTEQETDQLMKNAPETASSEVRAALTWPLAGLALGAVGIASAVLFATQPTALGETGASEAVAAATAAGPKGARPVETLYENLCSLCHGATGGGDGPTQLERPARSFIAGAYAYGDSLSRVMRTLEFGIPGTAMPAFGEILSVQERTAMARYVLGLRQKPRAVFANEGDVVLGSRPVVLQGAFKHPSTQEIEPRAQLVGFPGGTSVLIGSQNRSVLAIYQGSEAGPKGDAFARRADWRGQGGSPVRPLGETAWSSQVETAIAPYKTPYAAADGRPLSIRPLSTRVHAEHVTTRFRLVDPSGAQVGEGVETLRCPDGDRPAVIQTMEITEGADAIIRTPLEAEEVAAGDRGTAVQVAPGAFVYDADAAQAESSTGRIQRSFVYAQRWSRSLLPSPR